MAYRLPYDRAELEDLAGKINSIAAASVQVVFNNNYEDQGAAERARS